MKIFATGSLGVCLLALVACDRPAAPAASSQPPRPAATSSEAAPATTTQPDEPSGPLPPRTRPIAVTAFEPDVIGSIYSTDFQDLVMDRWDEAGAAGRYALGQGRFEGSRQKGSDGPEGIDTIEGYWIQASSDQRCETAREGSHHWGRFQFNVMRGGKSFIGFWSYCEGATLNRWNGEFSRFDPEIRAAVEALLANPAQPAP